LEEPLCHLFVSSPILFFVAENPKMHRPRQLLLAGSSLILLWLSAPSWLNSMLPPGVAQAADSKPADAKPAEAKPADAKPADSKPNEQQNPAVQDAPKTVEFVLYPAAPPATALGLRLLPRYLEITPGNAATLYLKALVVSSEYSDRTSTEVAQKIDRWLETPPSQLPKEEVQQFLETYRSTLALLRIAARRDHCDWDPPIRESNVYTILLPEIQNMRRFAHMLALQARLQIAEGHPAEAIDTLATGFAMARHTADCPFLVSGLVGVAISGILQRQVDALVQMPNCPNLYWCLTALPDPFIDFRPAYELEWENIYLIFPELRGVNHAEHTPAEWQSALASLLRRRSELGRELRMVNMSDFGDSVLEAAKIVTGYPKARAGLIAAGRTAKEVDAMPPAQVILLYSVFLYERANDEQYKWANIPYWQSREPLARSAKNLEARLREDEVIPLAQLLVPATFAVQGATARNQRRFAALRTIEALRFYADLHQGNFPVALAEIEEVPLPIDPVTGKPFDYQRLAEGRAVLEAKPPVGESWQRFGLRYELTVAGQKK
jgi:hypothetical protein